MSYFNTRAIPLFPSYALTPKKEKELDDFLGFLDKTGVGDLLISEDQNWNKSAGGRPSISKYSLFATILYALRIIWFSVSLFSIQPGWSLKE